MQFRVETKNFVATGEITQTGVQYSVRARSQTARIVVKLRNLKKDGLNGSASLEVVADTLRQYEGFCQDIDSVRA